MYELIDVFKVPTPPEDLAVYQVSYQLSRISSFIFLLLRMGFYPTKVHIHVQFTDEG